MEASGNVTEDQTDMDQFTEEVLRKYEIENIAIRVTVELISLITLVCIICDVLSCFVIFKFRRLRQNAMYKILANWFFLNSIFMFTSPILSRAAVDMRIANYMGTEAQCIMGHFEMVSFTGTLLCVLLLTFHWYFQFYHPSVSAKYDKCIIYLIGVMNVMLIVSGIYVVISCERLGNSPEITIIMVAVYIFFTTFMFVINIVHITKKNILGNTMEKNVSYILTNIYFLLHLSLTIIYLLYALSMGNLYFLIAVLICGIFTIVCPLYFFLILYKHDKHFNTLTRHVVCCKCTKYTGDELCDQSVHFTNNQV